MIRNVLLAFMICSGMTLLGGCSSVMSHTGGKEGTYPMDTLLLPWDVFRKDSSVRSRVEKSEANAQATNAVIPPARMPDN
ncbi:MAG: YceK/YidQ family lipoprotein [Escherichia coli]|nr:YceK/YidQ family lipoprotein [Escherichia coli]